jgi:surfeit locus 1 family protein
VPVGQLPVDTATARWRRVRLVGTWDFDREIALMGRSLEGAPGVNLITPLRLERGDRAVLVNRGWVYAPDGMTVDFARWREPARAAVDGIVEEFQPSGGDPRAATHRRAWRVLDGRQLRALFPYAIAPFYVVALRDTTRGVAGGGEGRGSVPVRLLPPALDDGPHRSYAIQWFSFAAIALVGVSALIWQDVRRRPGGVERDVTT